MTPSRRRAGARHEQPGVSERQGRALPPAAASSAPGAGPVPRGFSRPIWLLFSQCPSSQGTWGCGVVICSVSFVFPVRIQHTLVSLMLIFKNIFISSFATFISFLYPPLHQGTEENLKKSLSCELMIRWVSRAGLSDTKPWDFSL